MNKILQGDCLIQLKTLEDNSVDSIVTDPPYELGFMGKKWDSTGIVNNTLMWAECLRVLKPGGHLLAFSGTRTYHRMAVAIEDAGFEVRDMIEWVYGCLSEDTEILTENGYKLFKDISKEEKICIYNKDNNSYSYETPEKWSSYQVENEDCYSIRSEETDQIVSKNHRCLVERNGKLEFEFAENLSEKEIVPLAINFVSGYSSDGYHSFDELYNYRKIYNAMLFNKFASGHKYGFAPNYDTHKSKKHFDGGDCFGGGWFVVQATLPTGQISNHYELKDWDLFNVPEREFADKWDGHTPLVALNRMVEFCHGEKIIYKPKTTEAIITKIKYSGIIFCPTVSTGAFVARRNGQVFITGNSGFPKSLNIGKAVDKLQGNEREVVGEKLTGGIKRPAKALKSSDEYDETRTNNYTSGQTIIEDTKGTSEYEGWGTSLKPSHEPICMARKPLARVFLIELYEMYGFDHYITTSTAYKGTEKKPNKRYESYIGKGYIPVEENTDEIRERVTAQVEKKYKEAEDDITNYEAEIEEKILKATPKPVFRFVTKLATNPSVESSWTVETAKGIEVLKTEGYKKIWKKTVAVNALKYGTGGISIDGSRVGTEDKLSFGNRELGDGIKYGKCIPATEGIQNPQGRFPANLIHDNSEEVRKCFPETKSGSGVKKKASGTADGIFNINKIEGEYLNGDSGNASRFFKSIIYQAKASKSERNKGCEGLEEKELKGMNASPRENHGEVRDVSFHKNNHPTVKPVALMEYLIKMVTPKGGAVLDPFMGSGSTGVAAVQNGFDFIGIDMTPEYIEIAKARIENTEQCLGI